MRWAVPHGMWVTGTSSPSEFIAKIMEFHVKDGVAERIACPTLVCSEDPDALSAGTAQPEQLFEHLTCDKTFLRFTRDEGADEQGTGPPARDSSLRGRPGGCRQGVVSVCSRRSSTAAVIRP